jgi:hypothetical protein
LADSPQLPLRLTPQENQEASALQQAAVSLAGALS